MADLITVVEVEGPRAAFVASILESHGLTVFVENENTSNMLPHVSPFAKIQVPQDQVTQAQEALKAMPPESVDPESIELED